MNEHMSKAFSFKNEWAHKTSFFTPLLFILFAREPFDLEEYLDYMIQLSGSNGLSYIYNSKCYPEPYNVYLQHVRIV